MRELSLNVMDIAQNSISAQATLLTLTIEENQPEDRLVITLEDNGRGMSAQQVERVTDPFYTTRTTRKVGLGIPLFKMEAEMTGGSFSITSQQGVGTRVCAIFRPSSVDMIPLGNINETVQLLISCNPLIDLCYTRSYTPAQGENRTFTLDTREMREMLGDEVSLDSPDVVLWIRDYLAEQTELLLCP